MWWKRIVREPLVHFVVLGAVLFAIDGGRESRPAAPAPVATEAPPATPPDDRVIRVDAERRRVLTAVAEKRLGRTPSAAEIDEEVARWIDEEVLYREALARGLDRDDPVIHERVASRMAYVLEQALIVPEPSEAQLRAWFEQHQDQWAKPERVDFTHIYIANADEARATEIEKALAAGAPPETLGDHFSGGHRYRGRKLADLTDTFGAEFTAGLESQPVGTWQRRRSKHGLHLVRVDRVSAAQAPDFAAARLDVRQAWMDHERGRLLAERVAHLRAGWRVEK